MTRIKVSVIIPVYNSVKYLKESLDSVLKQTLKEIEIICVDDGSNDGSGILLKEYATRDDRIVLFSQTNRGVSTARNVGIQAAKGEYIYFLDSDDYIEPDTLETACREMDIKNLGIVYFDTYAFSEGDISEKIVEEKNKAYHRKNDYSSIYTGAQLLYEFLKNQDYVCSIWKQMIRRDLLQENNLCFYDGIIYEDELYTIQTMLLARRVSYIHRRLHHRRLRPNSIVTSHLSFQNVYGYFICVKEAYPFLLQHGCEAERLVQLMDYLRRVAFRARNQYIQLLETEQLKYEALSEEEKFLFQLCITDYSNSVKQRDEISEKNKNLLQENGSVKKELLKAQKKNVQMLKYKTARIDIKNSGSETNNLSLISCSDAKVKIQTPDWFINEQGTGLVVHSVANVLDMKFKCIGNGDLKIVLRGMDCRDKNGKRFPVWIGCTRLEIDDACLFDNLHLICHDSPFITNIKVTDGQIITIHLEWQEAQDLIAKEREMHLKLIDQTRQKVISLEKANAETAKKLGDTQQKVVNLEKVNAETAKKLGDTQQKVDNLEKEKTNTIEKLKKSQNKADNLANELSNVKNGWSFRIGRAVTWIPRKIKGFLK